MEFNHELLPKRPMIRVRDFGRLQNIEPPKEITAEDLFALDTNDLVSEITTLGEDRAPPPPYEIAAGQVWPMIAQAHVVREAPQPIRHTVVVNNFNRGEYEDPVSNTVVVFPATGGQQTDRIRVMNGHMLQPTVSGVHPSYTFDHSYVLTSPAISINNNIPVATNVVSTQTAAQVKTTPILFKPPPVPKSTLPSWNDDDQNAPKIGRCVSLAGSKKGPNSWDINLPGGQNAQVNVPQISKQHNQRPVIIKSPNIGNGSRLLIRKGVGSSPNVLSDATNTLLRSALETNTLNANCSGSIVNNSRPQQLNDIEGLSLPAICSIEEYGSSPIASKADALSRLIENALLKSSSKTVLPQGVETKKDAPRPRRRDYPVKRCFVKVTRLTAKEIKTWCELKEPPKKTNSEESISQKKKKKKKSTRQERQKDLITADEPKTDSFKEETSNKDLSVRETSDSNQKQDLIVEKSQEDPRKDLPNDVNQHLRTEETSKKELNVSQRPNEIKTRWQQLCSGCKRFFYRRHLWMNVDSVKIFCEDCLKKSLRRRNKQSTFENLMASIREIGDLSGGEEGNLETSRRKEMRRVSRNVVKKGKKRV